MIQYHTDSEASISVLRESEHIDVCFAVEDVERGTWISTWVLGWVLGSIHPSRRTEYRAKDGTKRGENVRWLRFICNDPACDAVMLVKENDLYAVLPRC